MPARAKPNSSPSDVLLRETQTMLVPLARMLVAHGVTYPQLARALKPVFLQAAREELARAGKPATDSALSLLSGVHRKDVRAIARESDGDAPARDRALSLAAEVFTRWTNDRRYLDARRRPRQLPLREAGRSLSFDALVRSVSKDFHPRSVLDELVRLGVAEVDGEQVRARRAAFIPLEGLREVAYYVGGNVHDHLAAAAANLHAVGGDTPSPFLEHAVYADELSAQSAAQLQRLAKKLWANAVAKVVAAATTAVEADRGRPPAQRTARMRFGAYFYAEPQAAPTPAARKTQRRRST